MCLEPIFNGALVVGENTVDLIPWVRPELPVEQPRDGLLDCLELLFVQLPVERTYALIRICQIEFCEDRITQQFAPRHHRLRVEHPLKLALGSVPGQGFWIPRMQSQIMQ